MSGKKPDYYNSVNNPITFSSDEVLVRNYKNFNLTYDELINNSQNTRLARRNERNGTNIIPRRQNAWEVIKVYEAAARLAAERHIEKYGSDYKYKPENL
uniref:HMG box protein n=1 Tax=Rhizophagus irregularis TaxID=588596 RepID=S5NU54_9GLOM|nr:HMG box protein [Rhizophagus irregularis]